MAITAARELPAPRKHPIDLDAVADDLLVFDYDPDSDTLMVHLRGRGRPAVSIEAGANAYVRLDRAADEIVGLHLENVRRAIVPKHPELLDHAATYGIEHTPETEGSGTAPPARRRAALAALAPLFAAGTVAVQSR